jgi:hypothetical protein
MMPACLGPLHPGHGLSERVFGALRQPTCTHLCVLPLISRVDGGCARHPTCTLHFAPHGGWQIIPYIASQFRKDKIWLRRTKPSKRQYQVVVAIDNSRSMRDTAARSMACEALATICKAMAKLEVRGYVNVHVNVNELRLGFSNTTRNPEGILSHNNRKYSWVSSHVKATPQPDGRCALHPTHGPRVCYRAPPPALRIRAPPTHRWETLAW